MKESDLWFSGGERERGGGGEDTVIEALLGTNNPTVLFPIDTAVMQAFAAAEQRRESKPQGLVAICKQYNIDDRFTALETTCAAVSHWFL